MRRNNENTIKAVKNSMPGGKRSRGRLRPQEQMVGRDSKGFGKFSVARLVKCFPRSSEM